LDSFSRKPFTNTFSQTFTIRNILLKNQPTFTPSKNPTAKPIHTPQSPQRHASPLRGEWQHFSPKKNEKNFLAITSSL
jgi:hypothetical protein